MGGKKHDELARSNSTQLFDVHDRTIATIYNKQQFHRRSNIMDIDSNIFILLCFFVLWFPAEAFDNEDESDFQQLSKILRKPRLLERHKHHNYQVRISEEKLRKLAFCL